ncbi:hypothetical protein LINPERPRIM_LOCUS38596 [Linum perenne]
MGAKFQRGGTHQIHPYMGAPSKAPYTIFQSSGGY